MTLVTAALASTVLQHEGTPNYAAAVRSWVSHAKKAFGVHTSDLCEQLQKRISALPMVSARAADKPSDSQSSTTATAKVDSKSSASTEEAPPCAPLKKKRKMSAT